MEYTPNLNVNKDSDIVDKLMMKPPYYIISSNELVEAANLIVSLRQQTLFQASEFKDLALKLNNGKTYRHNYAPSVGCIF